MIETLGVVSRFRRKMAHFNDSSTKWWIVDQGIDSIRPFPGLNLSQQTLACFTICSAQLVQHFTKRSLSISCRSGFWTRKSNSFQSADETMKCDNVSVQHFQLLKKNSTDCTRYIEAASIADSFQFFRFEFDWLVSGSSGDPIGRNWSWLKMKFLFISSSASTAVRWSIQLQLNENWRGPKLMYCGRWENFWSSWIRRHLIQSMANVFTLDYCSNIRTGSCQHGHTPNWTA